MPVRVTNTIDLGKAARAMPMALREQLLIAARLVIDDITERVRRGVKLTGHVQRQNLPATQVDKRKRLGHDRPLVESGKLGRPQAWRINGVPSQVASPPSRLKVTIGHPLLTDTTFGRRTYSGRYYAEFLPHLERQGYDLPIGVSRDVARKLRKLTPVAFQAALAEGRSAGSISVRQIQQKLRRVNRG